MSLIDKFLDAIKLNDDGYDEDEFLDDDTDDESEYQDTKVKRRFFSRIEDGDDDYDAPKEKSAPAEEPEVRPAPKQTAKPAAPSRREKTSRPKAKPAPKRRSTSGSMEVSVIKPTSMEDAREIADTLLDDCTIVLNLEGLDVDNAQRIIDFTCGACYSLNGSIQMISSYIFILTPASVDISGDYQSILSDAFDIPSMRSQY